MGRNRNAVQQQIPAEVAQPSPLVPAQYVPAEQNLENIGYFSAGYKRKFPTTPKETKSVTIVTSGVERQINIIPSSYGYPNSEDFDLYRAFLKICYEHTQMVGRYKNGEWRPHPEIKVPISFSTLKLLRDAGYQKNQDALQLVRDWIKRGVVTGIQGRLYEAKTGQFQERTVTLFSDARSRGETLRNGRVAERNYIWPSPWFLSNIYYFYTRRVDLAFHRRLRRPIAKILYPLMDTGWYASGGTSWAKRYTDLCSILFIRCYTHVSQVAEQLDPSHDELQRAHFLDHWAYERDENDKWTGVIRWWPGRKWFADQEERRRRRDQSDRIEKAQELPLHVCPAPVNRNSEQTGSSTTPVAETVIFEERVKRFYTGIGQTRISKQKSTKGVRILIDLAEQGFTLDDIDCAIRWTLRSKERFPDRIFSIAILPEVIGQALEVNGTRKRLEERKLLEHTEEQQREAEEALRSRLTEIYKALPADKQAALTQTARHNLLQQGFKEQFLLDTVVRTEVLRLVADESG